MQKVSRPSLRGSYEFQEKSSEENRRVYSSCSNSKVLNIMKQQRDNILNDIDIIKNDLKETKNILKQDEKESIRTACIL